MIDGDERMECEFGYTVDERKTCPNAQTVNCKKIKDYCEWKEPV